MWLIPYEHLIVKTHLSQNRVIQKLQDITDTSGKIIWFPTFSTKHKLYRGKINQESFSIYRWINHQDSFLLIIDGDFLPQGTGSRIRIKLHLHWLVMIFMTLWLGFFGIAFVNQVLMDISYFSQFGTLPSELASGLIPLFFFLFGYLMMIIAFKVNVKREKLFIQELADAANIVRVDILDVEETYN